MKHLFGPVNSRRLGLSLGIDLVPFKTCTLDCVYCECGGTDKLTTKRSEYVPTKEVIEEIKTYLAAGPQLDTLTFSGSGEPTLHNGIGEIIQFIKKEFPEYTLALLTNGTLFWKDEVRRAVQDVDIIIPSLDAATLPVFEKINRPAKEVTLKRTIEGLSKLRENFTGTFLLEIFIVPGCNDTDKELAGLKKIVANIKPDRIQLNSLHRPGTENWVGHVSEELLRNIMARFSPFPVDIVQYGTAIQEREIMRGSTDIIAAIIATLSRRPSTIDDLHFAMGIERTQLGRILHDLVDSGRILLRIQADKEFYTLNKNK